MYDIKNMTPVDLGAPVDSIWANNYFFNVKIEKRVGILSLMNFENPLYFLLKVKYLSKHFS